MKLLGNYKEKDYATHNVPFGANVFLDVQSADVMTYTGNALDMDNRCSVRVYSGFFIYHIRKISGEYLSPEVANDFVKTLAMNDVVDLEQYDMAFFHAWDIRPDSFSIRNEIDESDYSSIPIEVVVVDR